MAEIIEIPLSPISSIPDNARRETWTVRGETNEVPFYAFGPHKIWGATAMVLAELLDDIRPSAENNILQYPIEESIEMKQTALLPGPGLPRSRGLREKGNVARIDRRRLRRPGS